MLISVAATSTVATNFLGMTILSATVYACKLASANTKNKIYINFGASEAGILMIVLSKGSTMLGLSRIL